MSCQAVLTEASFLVYSTTLSLLSFVHFHVGTHYHLNGPGLAQPRQQYLGNLYIPQTRSSPLMDAPCKMRAAPCLFAPLIRFVMPTIRSIYGPYQHSSTPRSFAVVALALAYRGRARSDLDPRWTGGHDRRRAGCHPH